MSPNPNVLFVYNVPLAKKNIPDKAQYFQQMEIGSQILFWNNETQTYINTTIYSIEPVQMAPETVKGFVSLVDNLSLSTIC